MIKYGLKLWTNNTDLLDQAISLRKKNIIDFVELYYNDTESLNLDILTKLTIIPVNIHSSDNQGFEEFKIGKRELRIWEKIKSLATTFNSSHIIVHPGRGHSLESFNLNMRKIDDPRILVENMAGLDINNCPMYASSLADLEKIYEIKNICFDFEKAVKSAVYQEIDYKIFIARCLDKLKPYYFHISGGNKNSPKDEHLDLWESNFDVKWIKEKLLEISKFKDVFIVVETPKKANNLKNDVSNIEYFRKLLNRRVSVNLIK